MDLWVREARLFKYGSGTGTNFSDLRAEGEALSGGGRSSGLMGFLRIGDRAAGAIKSGGTTRRAAKMVIVDADHPDIEAFVNWKVVEEQKVASLVAGSKMHQEKLGGIFAAIRAWDGVEGDATDPAANAGLKAAIRSAKKAAIPETYVARVLQYARQGYASIHFPTYDVDWDSEAYSTVSGQNSNNSIRVTDAFLRAVREDAPWELLRRTDGKVAKTIRARELWEQVGHAAWACADPGIQYHDTVNAWHTCPEDGADPRLEPLLGVHVPRRHGLQPGLGQPADLLARRRVRRRGLRARRPALDADAGDQRADGAVPRRRRSRSAATTSARWAWATPTSAVC